MQNFITLPKKDLTLLTKCVDVVSKCVMSSEHSSHILIRTLNQSLIELVNLCEPYMIRLTLDNTTGAMFHPMVVHKDVLNKVLQSSDEVKIGMKDNNWFFEALGVDVYLRTITTDLSIYDTFSMDVVGEKELDMKAFVDFSTAYTLTNRTMASEQLAVNVDGRAYFKTSASSANYKSPVSDDCVLTNSVMSLMMLASEQGSVKYTIEGKTIVISTDSLDIKAPLRKTDDNCKLIATSQELSLNKSHVMKWDVATINLFIKKINSLGYFHENLTITPNNERLDIVVYDSEVSKSWSYTFPITCDGEVKSEQYIFSIQGLTQYMGMLPSNAEVSFVKSGLKAYIEGNVLVLRRQSRL